MTITLTREEAQQVLDALECMNEGAFNAEIKLLRARLSAPEPVPVAGYRWKKGRTPPSVTFTTTAQREWQGLTDAEAEQIVDDYWHDVDMFIEAIEAKLKDKNT